MNSNKFTLGSKIAIAIALSICTLPCFAINIIPEFTAGVLVCNNHGTSCQPVMCSTNPNHPTTTPTGSNVVSPFNFMSEGAGFTSTPYPTSCLSPQEMTSVNNAAERLNGIIPDNITVKIEFYKTESPFIANFARLVMLSPVDPVHNPGAAYDAVVDRLKAKNLLNNLSNTNITGPYSVNSTLLLPSYSQLNVAYPQTYGYFVFSDFFDNTPQTFEYYPQVYNFNTATFAPLLKPIVMFDTIAHYNMLTFNGTVPLPGVTVTNFPIAYANTIPDANGVAVVSYPAEFGATEFYSENDPKIVAQQKEIPAIVAGNYFTLANQAAVQGNSIAGIFPANYNPAYDFNALANYDILEQLGILSAQDYVSSSDYIAPPYASGVWVSDLFIMDKSKALQINSPNSFASAARLQAFEGTLLNNGNTAGHHVFVYHVGLAKNDTTKYLGLEEILGLDYDTFSCSIPTSDTINYATFQQSDDSPSFTDPWGNVLNSSLSNCSTYIFGQINPLSIRELIRLNALGYGVVNEDSVVNGRLAQ